MSENSVLHDPEYTTPGTSKGLFGVFRHRYLLSLLLRKGITTRYYGSALGWIWSYIRPGAQFLMYYIVIGVILQANRGLEWFPIYLFSGIVAVNLFSEALRNTTSSIVDNKSLVRKIYLPRELFPVSALGVAFIHFLPQTALLLVVTILCGWTLSWLQVLTFVAGVAMILTFALGLGLFFGAINVAYRDAKNFVDIILMFATWASPVLYSWTMLAERAPDWLMRIYMSNPMTGAVELFHTTFWQSLPMTSEPVRPDLLTYGSIGGAIAIGTLVIGQFVFRKLEGSFAQRL
ncbi:ABC transporter permease [Leucobacter sp. GX24907]